MDYRAPLTAVGVGISTFLVVTVLVIELLNFEFSAIIALPVGILAGLAGLAIALFAFNRVEATLQYVAEAIAAFGYTVMLLLGVRYVNLAGLRQTISFDLLVVLAIGVAIAVFVGTWRRGRSTAAP